jgi:hypothetical protein
MEIRSRPRQLKAGRVNRVAPVQCKLGDLKKNCKKFSQTFLHLAQQPPTLAQRNLVLSSKYSARSFLSVMV